MKPLDELMVKRLKLKYRIMHQRAAVSDDLEYIRDHAGNLALSGLGSLFLSPRGKRARAGESFFGEKSELFPGLGEQLNALLPVVLGMVSPLLLRSVLKRVGGLFCRKRRRC